MAVKYKTSRSFFFPPVVEEMTCPGAQTVTSSVTSPGGKQIKRQNVIPPGLLSCFSYWKPTQVDLVCGCVPGCGEDGVDEGILGILGTHEEHVLCKIQERKKDKLGSWALCANLFAVFNNSRISSKCVSMPLTPGTEHRRRAFRKVVHLFTRLLWPPMSF